MKMDEFKLKFRALTKYNVGINERVVSYLYSSGYQSFVLNELSNQESIEHVVEKLNEKEESRKNRKDTFYIKKYGKRKYINLNKDIGFYNRKLSI